METVFAWMIILGSIYGLILLILNAVYVVMRLWNFIKSRRKRNEI